MHSIKKFFGTLLLIVTVLFTMNSCAENDFVINSENPILFSSDYIGKPASRAAGDINNSNVKSNSFYVYGGAQGKANLLFDKQIVTHDGSAWTYYPLKYYDSEKEYTFTGVMPAKIESDSYGIINDQTSYADGKITILNVPITQPIIDSDENEVGIDYLVSDAVDNHKREDGTVLLNFKHILSRFSIYVYTGADKATVTLNQMSIYLPNGGAKYEQANHEGPVSRVVDANYEIQPGDKWTWDTFENKYSGEPLTTYKEYQLLTNKTTSKNVPYFDGIPNVSDIPEGLMPVEFFIAPIDHRKFAKKEDLQLYMKLKFTVQYEDGIKQEIVRDEPIKIQDLHSFTQNYRTNLFVKLLAENDVIAFNVKVAPFENETNHWVDQYGYSFDLVEYSQTPGLPIMEISGVLDNFGNTLQGDSKTELTYFLENLYPVTGTESDNVLLEEKQLEFSGWDNKTDGDFNEPHITDNRYGKFTIDLSGVPVTAGDYWMIIRNTMNDVRKYKIRLVPGMSMAFTINVNSGDTYTIPFVTYETASSYFDAYISQVLTVEQWQAWGAKGNSTTYAGYTADLNAWINIQLAQEGNPASPAKDVCFIYPSNLYIDYGDFSPIATVNKGDYVINSTLPKHTYDASGEYTITIYTDETNPVNYQIPQISWAASHVEFNSELNGHENNHDSKLISVDSPILHMDYDKWSYHGLTFGAHAIAATFNLYTLSFIPFAYDLVIGEHRMGCSMLSCIFGTCSSLRKISGQVFKHNAENYAVDYTFQFCHALESIPSDLFTGCDIIESMYYTFDNAALTSIPSGLFDGFTHDIWFKCTFLDCTKLDNSNVADNLFANCGANSSYDGVFNGTGVTKYNNLY